MLNYTLEKYANLQIPHILRSVLRLDHSLLKWFPNFLHLRTFWQPTSTNCTLHISKMFVINIVAVISNLYADVSAFSAIIKFFREHLNVLVRTLRVTRIPGWESLAHSKASSPQTAI